MRSDCLFVTALFGAAALIACNDAQTRQKNSPEARTEALEQRVKDLEKLTASPSPSAAAEVAPQPQSLAVAPAQPAPVAAPRHVTAPTQVPARRSTAASSRVTQDAGRESRVVADEAGSRPIAKEPRSEPIERVVIPSGTSLTLVLENTVSSATSHEGDPVTARVERAVSEEGNVLLPGGSVLKGHVNDAEPSGRVSGRARLAIAFDSIVIRGRSHELNTTEISAEAADTHSHDAKVVGGSAAAGAIVGAIAHGKSGALKGAVIGAGVGTGAVLVTKGKEIEIPSGSRWTVTTKSGLRAY